MERLKPKLTGARISDEETILLRELHVKYGFPKILMDWMQHYPLSNTIFKYREAATGLEHVFRWLTPDHARSEIEDTYPGVVVAQLGYIPVGGCLVGSGDPYFVRDRGDGELLLVQISHHFDSPDADEDLIWPVGESLAKVLLGAEISGPS